jgi:hypothetical protein
MTTYRNIVASLWRQNRLWCLPIAGAVMFIASLFIAPTFASYLDKMERDKTASFFLLDALNKYTGGIGTLNNAQFLVYCGILIFALGILCLSGLFFWQDFRRTHRRISEDLDEFGRKAPVIIILTAFFMGYNSAIADCGMVVQTRLPQPTNSQNSTTAILPAPSGPFQLLSPVAMADTESLITLRPVAGGPTRTIYGKGADVIQTKDGLIYFSLLDGSMFRIIIPVGANANDPMTWLLMDHNGTIYQPDCGILCVLGIGLVLVVIGGVIYVVHKIICAGRAIASNHDIAISNASRLMFEDPGFMPDVPPPALGSDSTVSTNGPCVVTFPSGVTMTLGLTGMLDGQNGSPDDNDYLLPVDTNLTDFAGNSIGEKECLTVDPTNLIAFKGPSPYGLQTFESADIISWTPVNYRYNELIWKGYSGGTLASITRISFYGQNPFATNCTMVIGIPFAESPPLYSSKGFPTQPGTRQMFYKTIFSPIPGQ